MPLLHNEPVTIRFTDEQKQWLDSEAERLDRTIAWIVRKAVEVAMADSKYAQDKHTRLHTAR